MKLKLLAVAVATAVATTPAFADSEAKSKAGGGMSVETGDVKLKVGARLMYDIDWFDDEAFNGGTDSGSDSELRRARIYVSGEMGDWKAKVQGDFKDNGGTKLSDAYIQYKGWDGVDLTLGKHKEPFGLEEQTSSKDITAIERTMITNALAPGKNYGVSLGGSDKAYSWKVGLYDHGEDGNNIATGVTGRVTFAPVITKNQVFHLGFGYRQSEIGKDDGENVYKEADQRLEIHTANEKVGSGSILGEKINAYNLEVAYAAGPFHFQGEYFDAEVDGGGWTTDTDIEGYYAQVGYVLTGESRPYKGGKFKRVSPKGADGAWEMFYRGSEYKPGSDKGTAHTFGLNYYASKAVRVGVNFVKGDLTEFDSGVNNFVDKDGNAIALRFQYVF